MNARDKGYCLEVHISSGRFVHVCSMKQSHDWRHSCACGQSFNDNDVKTTDKEYKNEKEIYVTY